MPKKQFFRSRFFFPQPQPKPNPPVPCSPASSERERESKKAKFSRGKGPGAQWLERWFSGLKVASSKLGGVSWAGRNNVSGSQLYPHVDFEGTGSSPSMRGKKSGSGKIVVVAKPDFMQ